MSRYPEGTEASIQELLESRGLAWGDVVTVTEGGSTAHGISVGLDDLDFTVVRVEPFSELVNGKERAAA